jgi:acetyl-CoA decarbonylase/synthase complex subunit delta
LIVASSPIDVNLAKQLNILLGNLGVQSDKIIIDPTTGGLGYGLEYSYSVMERIRMAALTQEDDKLQIPMISNVGNEVWKCKEARETIEEAPILGDPERRGILMETAAAVCYVMGGADAVILRHPESVRLVRAYIESMLNGGSLADVAEIQKSLELQEADLAAISPEPDLTIAEGAAPPKPKEAKAPPKKEEKPKAEEKVVQLKPEPAKPKAEEPAKAKAEAEAKPKAEEEAKKKAEEEAKAKAEEEAKKKAEAEAKAEAKVKEEEEAKKKAEEEAKKKAEQEAKKKAQAKEKEKEELLALRQKRAAQREKHEAERKAEAEAVAKTAAAQQVELVDRLIQNLDRIHRRV